MRSNLNRLRKYQRRKDRARNDRQKFTHLAALYWRCWHKIHGEHAQLWRAER